MAPPDVAAFGRELAERLAEALDGGLVGAYFVGSVALGGYIAGESDVDIVAVSEHQLPPEVKPLVADAVLEAAAACPTQGLEFTLYRQAVAGAPPRGADFELNANGGPRMPRSVHLDHHAEPGFWYIIDRAIAHRVGTTIVGPPAGQLFADIPRDVLLDAMKDSVRWHRDHEGATLYSVLNACRAWRFAAEDALWSKLEGAAWARPLWAHPELIDSAVALRHGTSANLQISQVDEFLEHVEGLISSALEGR
ncbi:MAG TPA: aminoglycoside adenylyltransferase domain-containing protein [Acidimicrobiales bacterium]|nr:aminoglycoside adenylyltransferase domain-containing protein [Acidimicrobiales bacterium]